jgi:hypothetical protein
MHVTFRDDVDDLRRRKCNTECISEDIGRFEMKLASKKYDIDN